MRRETNFAYSIYRESRMKLFELLGKNELIEHERILLEAHNKRMHEIAEAAPLDMLKNINLESLSDGHINERQINMLVKQHGLEKDYQAQSVRWSLFPYGRPLSMSMTRRRIP